MVSTDSDRRSASVAVALAIVAVALFAAAQAPLLPVGYLDEYDEFHTLSRSLSFLDSGDWFAIIINKKPEFNKPPLQYWISAILIQQGFAEVFATRLPAFMFGIGLLFATGVLAHAAAPKHPYAIAAAVILLAGSPLFWRHATSALLETGSAFFLTATVSCSLLALRHPRWWVLAGVFAGLGAMQKSPVAIVAMIAILVFARVSVLWSRERGTVSPRDRYVVIGVATALVLGALWPLIQISRFGWNYVRIFHREVIGRFAPDLASPVLSSDGAAAPSDWLGWMARDASLIWTAAGLAVLAVLVFRRFRARRELLILALGSVAFLLLLTFASGKTYPRYLLLILPCMVVLLAAVVAALTPVRPLVPALALLGLLIGPTPFRDIDALSAGDLRPNLIALDRFNSVLGNGETPFICILSAPHVRTTPPGAVEILVDADRPYRLLRKLSDLKKRGASKALAGPHAGLCPSASVDDIEAVIGPIEIQETLGDFVIWKRP